MSQVDVKIEEDELRTPEPLAALKTPEDANTVFYLWGGAGFTFFYVPSVQFWTLDAELKFEKLQSKFEWVGFVFVEPPCVVRRVLNDQNLSQNRFSADDMTVKIWFVEEYGTQQCTPISSVGVHCWVQTSMPHRRFSGMVLQFGLWYKCWKKGLTCFTILAI